MKKEAIRRRRDKYKIRRAVSPVISTIILIMIVIIIAIIIVLFFKNFFKEIILKEVGGNSKRVQDFCPEVVMTPIINEDGSFGVSNEGNVPVYNIVLKTSKAGSSSTTPLDKRLDPGYSIMIDVQIDPSDLSAGFYKRSDFEEVKIIPVLLGKRKSDLLEPYTCPDSYAVEI